jgi:hypothetical protein
MRTNCLFAGDELRHGTDLFDYDVVGDVRGVAPEQCAGYESTGAVAETDENQQCDCDENRAGANNTAWLSLWRRSRMRWSCHSTLGLKKAT